MINKSIKSNLKPGKDSDNQDVDCDPFIIDQPSEYQTPELLKWRNDIQWLDEMNSRGQYFTRKYYFGLKVTYSENCWGQSYNPSYPLTKEYRKKCCIACQPGEYLNQNENRCVNCEAGHECRSTLRKMLR